MTTPAIQRVLDLVDEAGVLRPRDLERRSIPRSYLQRLLERGEVVRVGRGLYMLPDADVTEHHSLVEACKRVPQGRQCRGSPLHPRGGRRDAGAGGARVDRISVRAGTWLFSLLSTNETVETLARSYFEVIGIPERARIDAFHLAIAVSYKIDYLLSWNCKHIASARVQKLLQKRNNELEIHTPILCTPEELMEV